MVSVTNISGTLVSSSVMNHMFGIKKKNHIFGLGSSCIFATPFFLDLFLKIKFVPIHLFET